MFFITQGKVRKQAAEAVRPMLRTIDMVGGLPPGFWDDLTATAFLHGCIRAVVGEISNQKYNGKTGVQITLDVLGDLAGQDAGVSVGEMHALLLNTEAFKEAFQAGVLSVMVAKHGPEKVQDDPIIQRAMLYLIDGEPATAASVSAALQVRYFYDRAEDLRVP